MVAGARNLSEVGDRIREAMSRAGAACPLCRVLSEAQFDWLARLPQQIVTSPEFCREFAQKYRFCPVHAVEFARLGSYRSVAILYQALAADILAHWDGEDALCACPLCRELDRLTYEWVLLFAQAMAAPSCRQQYLSGGGFCMSHLQMICHHADPDTADFLHETERAFWTRLERHLSSASHKGESPESSPESWEATRKSPARALEKLSGRPGLPLEIL